MDFDFATVQYLVGLVGYFWDIGHYHVSIALCMAMASTLFMTGRTVWGAGKLSWKAVKMFGRGVRWLFSSPPSGDLAQHLIDYVNSNGCALNGCDLVCGNLVMDVGNCVRVQKQSVRELMSVKDYNDLVTSLLEKRKALLAVEREAAVRQVMRAMPLALNYPAPKMTSEEMMHLPACVSFGPSEMPCCEPKANVNGR